MRLGYVLALLIPTVCVYGAIPDDSPVSSSDASGVRRTIFAHYDQSGVPGKEIVTGTAELPPGGVIGWHVHPGDEAGVILRGDVILQTRGQPDRMLKAGDHFFNPRGAVHNLVVAPGSNGALVFATWIVDKGQPLAQKRE